MTNRSRLNRTTINWISQSAPDPRLIINNDDPLQGYLVDWQWKWSQFNLGAGKQRIDYGKMSDGNFGFRTIFDGRQAWLVPYWSLGLSVTLLTAHLILWKPRRLSQPVR